MWCFKLFEKHPLNGCFLDTGHISTSNSATSQRKLHLGRSSVSAMFSDWSAFLSPVNSSNTVVTASINFSFIPVHFSSLSSWAGSTQDQGRTTRHSGSNQYLADWTILFAIIYYSFTITSCPSLISIVNLKPVILNNVVHNEFTHSTCASAILKFRYFSNTFKIKLSWNIDENFCSITCSNITLYHTTL